MKRWLVSFAFSILLMGGISTGVIYAQEDISVDSLIQEEKIVESENPDNMITEEAVVEPVSMDENVISDKTVLIAGADLQPSWGDTDSQQQIVTGISQAIYDDGYTDVDGVLYVGDYAKGDETVEKSDAGIETAIESFQSVYTDLSEQDMIFSQGNHEPFGTSYLAPSGNNDRDTYGVFVINEDDFMTFYPNSQNIDIEGLTNNTAVNLMNYLNEKIEEQYSNPIFVLSHIPLHVNSKMTGSGDGKYGNTIFNVLNEGAASGLNIVFLYGHNHNDSTGTLEDFHGGSSVFFRPGDEINIPLVTVEGNEWYSYTVVGYQTRTLNFVYMNAGYTGYYYGNADTSLSMTVFEFDDQEMKISRYGQAEGVSSFSGPYEIHNLKSKGTYEGSDEAYLLEVNKVVYTSPQTIALTNVTGSAIENYYDPGSEEASLDYYTVATTSSILGGKAIGGGCYQAGDNVTLKAYEAIVVTDISQTDSGYEFLGWAQGNTLLTQDAEYSFTMPSMNQTFTAYWQLANSGEYTIVDNGDGTKTIYKTGEVIIQFDTDHMEMNVGETAALNYSVVPASTVIEWGSEDENVATVVNGTITAVGEGTTVIKASTSDGLYSAFCSITVIEDPVLDSRHSLSLDGNIGVNFYFLFSDEVTEDQDSTVEFTVDGITSSMLVRDASVQTISNKSYRKFTVEVTSVQMTSDIFAKVFTSEGDTGYEESYSVKTYCDSKLSNSSTNQSLKDLITALLNYGGYAQIQFNTYTDRLANADLEDTDVSDVTAEMLQPYQSVKTGSAEGLTLRGSSLTLNSLTTIKHYFVVGEGHTIDEYTFTLNGETVTPVQSGSMYYVEIPNISSNELDTMYEVNVGNFGIQYSALSYAYNQLSKTTTSDALKNVCRALYKYNVAADAYFNS